MDPFSSRERLAAARESSPTGCTSMVLAAKVREGRFRSDLFFRINTFPLAVPPLRERREDIEPLARRLLEPLGRDLRRLGMRLSPGALEALRAYSWPGNVRELRNVLERAVLRAEEEEIQASDFRLVSVLGDIPAAEAKGTLAEL